MANKQNMLYPQNRALFRRKKEQTINVYYIRMNLKIVLVERSQIQKILYDFVDMKYPEKISLYV